METRRKPISRYHAFGCALALISLVGLTGCAALRGMQHTDPLTPEEHLNLGVSYERNGELDMALREYDRAASGLTKSMALTYRGNIYAGQNKTAEAEKEYRAALKENPDNVAALNNLAWLLAQQHKSLDEAELLIRHALELNPEPREPYEDTLKAVLDAR